MQNIKALTLKSLLFYTVLVFATSSCTETKSQNKKSSHKSLEANQKSDKNTNIAIGEVNDFSYLPTTNRGTIYKKANYL